MGLSSDTKNFVARHCQRGMAGYWLLQLLGQQRPLGRRTSMGKTVQGVNFGVVPEFKIKDDLNCPRRQRFSG